MCFAFVSYYPASSFTSCTQFGSMTVCQNESNANDLGGCTFNYGGLNPVEAFAYYQLGTFCDTTGNTCTPQCLDLLTDDPNACLTGNAKIMGEFFYPRTIGATVGGALQRASRSCDFQIYDGSATSVRDFGKVTLSLVAILVLVTAM